MDKTVILAIIIVVVVFAAYFAWDYFRKQGRLKQMRDAAARLGYQFDEKGADLLARLDGFPLLSLGRMRQVNNLLSTEVDRTAITLFDDSYLVGTGRNQRTHRQSLLLIESKQLDLPLFALHPEGLFHKLLSHLGQQDIDFEEQPGFSSAYSLRGPDEAQIRALFGSEALAFFAQRPGLYVEGNGQRLLYYRADKRVSPKEIPSFVQEGLAVLTTLVGK